MFTKQRLKNPTRIIFKIRIAKGCSRYVFLGSAGMIRNVVTCTMNDGPSYLRQVLIKQFPLRRQGPEHRIMKGCKSVDRRLFIEGVRQILWRQYACKSFEDVKMSPYCGTNHRINPHCVNFMN